MMTFPLLRTKKTNENEMAKVFIILLLYFLPYWLKEPVGILRLLLLIGAAVLIDVVFSLLRYKRIWCCVSGVITASMIGLLTAGVPLWGQLLGIAVGLVVGKHIWGGTGKNILNPAMVGLFWILLMFDYSYPFFQPTLLLLPAIFFGLYILSLRPFAGIGLMLGMIVSMIVLRDFSLMNIITYGVFFWGCLVVTDPVTVTSHRMAGFILGLLTGFAAYFFTFAPAAIPLSILMMNLCSSVFDDLTSQRRSTYKTSLRLPKAIIGAGYDKELIDLTKEASLSPSQNFLNLSKEELLKRLQKNDVFGMGGAAFPTYQKLITVMKSKGDEKQLILNGVECDPGLIHDAWLLRNYSEELQHGIDILCHCIDFTSVHLAVKDTAGLSFSKQVKVTSIADTYPAGAERILITAVIGKKLTNSQLPAEQGILVLNVQTVYAVWQAVCLNQQVNTRFLTVADLEQKKAKVVRVKLGSKISEVMEAVYPEAVNIFVGGGAMQAYRAEDASVIDQHTNFIATGKYPKFKESPQCSHCGSCTLHCPSGIKVNRIADLVDRGKQKAALKYHVTDCISCGSCSYTCPAGRNLAARVKLAKEAVSCGLSVN